MPVLSITHRRVMLTALFAAFALLPGTPVAATDFPGPPEMVIVTPDDQASAWQRLADFKTRIGVPTKVVTLSAIFAEYSGVDVPATIRAYLQAAHFAGADFALLAGDVTQIPIRRARTVFFGGNDLPTDLYYSDLDGTWDADGDGIYGEGFANASQPGDQVNLYPDLYVGRIPSRTVMEADGVVDKLLAYAQEPPAGFVPTALLIAEEGRATIAEDHSDLLSGHTVTRLYVDYQDYPGSLPATRQSVLDALETGHGFTYQLGNAPATDRFYVNGETVSAANISFLVNAPANGFLLATTEYTTDVTHNCVGNAWVRNPNGGGVGILGSTHFNFVSTLVSYETEFLHQVFEMGEAHAGIAAARAKTPFIVLSSPDNTHRWAQMTLNLLGDPEMWIWTAEPEPLELAHAGILDPDGTLYSVTMTSGGLPIESARVAFWKPGEVYEVGFTDASGLVTLPVDAASPGPFTVGAWVPNHLPIVEAGNVTSGVAPIEPPISLAQNRPNPFRTSTSFHFTLPRDNRGDRSASFQVFDARGRLVRDLFHCTGCPGSWNIAWDGRDDRGRLLPSGVYRYRLVQRDVTLTRQLVIAR